MMFLRKVMLALVITGGVAAPLAASGGVRRASFDRVPVRQPKAGPSAEGEAISENEPSGGSYHRSTGNKNTPQGHTATRNTGNRHKKASNSNKSH